MITMLTKFAKWSWIFRSASAFAVCCVLLKASITFAQERDVLFIVEGPRPVAKAMVTLEDRYGQPITYEEGPYTHPDELHDATVDPSARRRVLAPKQRRIEPHIQLSSSATRTELRDLVSRILRASEESHGASGSSFGVLQSHYGLHVVPTKVRDRAGVATAITPLLDTRITVRATGANVHTLLQSICSAVSEATGTTMLLAPVGVDWGRRPTAIAAENEPARDVLIRLFEEQNVVLSWHLLHDPTENRFILNVGRPGRLMPTN